MAARKPKAAEPVTAASARKDLVRLLREISDAGHQLWRVWSDFVEASAISISNRVDLRQHDAREARYLQIVGAYKQDQVHKLAHAFGALALSLEEEPADVLGSVFMELELGNRWKGQFFTPFHLCRLMAAMQMGDGVDAEIAAKGYITVNDPCVGGGAMPLAFAAELRAAGHDPARRLHVTAQDVDTTAVHMAYVQLSLMGVPAVVILGNSLAVEEREHWYTPAHALGGWSQRLHGQAPIGDLIAAVAHAAAAAEPANQPAATDVQLALPLGGRAA
jgi:type I restriction-modification system DNA methylase subunit